MKMYTRLKRDHKVYGAMRPQGRMVGGKGESGERGWEKVKGAPVGG